MSTFLPHDANDHAIPVMRLKPDGAHTIAASANSTKNTIAFGADTRVVSVYAAQDVYIAFGDASVTANTSDHFFPAGVYYDIAIGGGHTVHTPYIAVRAASGDGAVYISEKI